MSKVPLVKQLSLTAAVSQLVIITIGMALCVFIAKSSNGILFTCAAFLIYSIGMRKFLARDHRRGVRYCRHQQFEAAIQAFEASYDFFCRNLWIDRFRSVMLMSASAISYREMALCNIAFCYSQIGNGELAEKYYHRALEEFPDSVIAAASLRLIESVKGQFTNPISS